MSRTGGGGASSSRSVGGREHLQAKRRRFNLQVENLHCLKSLIPANSLNHRKSVRSLRCVLIVIPLKKAISVGLLTLDTFACRSRSGGLPNSRNWHHSFIQRPTPRGQRHRRPRLKTRGAVTLRRSDRPAASPTDCLVSRKGHGEGKEEERALT